jgi:clan AA aspartic protease (TIGR02281 family)
MAKIKFDREAPVIVVYVTIKGRVMETARMALDTAATYTMIPWDIAGALGYEPEKSKERVDMVTASGVERAPLITLESVSLGGEEVKEVQALVHDLPPRSYVDGLLGLSFLRNFRVSLNFKEGILELTPYS